MFSGGVNFRPSARPPGHRPLIDIVQALHVERFPERAGFNDFEDCSLAAARLRGALTARRAVAVIIKPNGKTAAIGAAAWKNDDFWHDMFRDYGASSPRYFISELHAARILIPSELSGAPSLKLPAEFQLLVDTYVSLGIPDDFPIARGDIETAMRFRLPRTPTITLHKLTTFIRLVRSFDRPYGGRTRETLPPHVAAWRAKYVLAPARKNRKTRTV